MQHLLTEGITQALIILILGIIVILSNLIVIATFINFRGILSIQVSGVWIIYLNYFSGPQDVINIYLLSLAFADLICGLIIVPLSIYPALHSGAKKLVLVSQDFFLKNVFQF